jgi:hypothetical protein
MPLSGLGVKRAAIFAGANAYSSEQRANETVIVPASFKSLGLLRTFGVFFGKLS